MKLVVRGFGVDIRHVVEVERDQVEAMFWITDFHGIRTPIKGVCGKNIRSVQKAVVVMKPYPPTCELCMYITKGETFDNAAIYETDPGGLEVDNDGTATSHSTPL